MDSGNSFLHQHNGGHDILVTTSSTSQIDMPAYNTTILAI